jgi:hypothetical protein
MIMVFFFLGCSRKPPVHYSSLPLVLHGLSISSSLTYHYKWRLQVMKLLSMQFFSDLLLFHPSLVKIFSSASYSETFLVCSSLGVRDQVSHPWKTNSKDLSPWEAARVVSYCHISPETAYIGTYITTWFLYVSFICELCKGTGKKLSLCLTK